MLVMLPLMGFPGDSVVKNPPANTGDIRDKGSIFGSGKSPGEGNGNPLQYCCLGNPNGQRRLAGYSPRGCKSWTRLKRLSICMHAIHRLSSVWLQGMGAEGLRQENMKIN